MAAALLFALGAKVAPAQTVDDVVRRYLEARGGAAKLRAVESLRFTGTMEMPDVSGAFVLELARPNRMRTEFVVQGQTGVRAFDGQHAWSRLPLPGEPPRPMSPEEAADARAQADVDLSPLVDSTAKGFTVELVGRDRLPGGEIWKLIVRGRDGPAALALPRRAQPPRGPDGRLAHWSTGQPVDFVTEVSDYRPVGGLMFPHRIEVGPKRQARAPAAGDPESRDQPAARRVPLRDARCRPPQVARRRSRAARCATLTPAAASLGRVSRGPWTGGSGFSAVWCCCWAKSSRPAASSSSSSGPVRSWSAP